MPSMHERVARGLARRAGLRVFRFFTRPLDPQSPPTAPPGLELRMVQERDLEPYFRLAHLDLEAARVRTAFARGDLCAAAFESGELVGYCWFAFAALPHLDGVWVDFHRQGAWMYKSLVLPSRRGRKIAPALYRLADRQCSEQGRNFIISCIETHNRPSIAAKRRAYTPAGYAGYFRHGATLWTWSTPAAARIALRFHLPG